MSAFGLFKKDEVNKVKPLNNLLQLQSLIKTQTLILTKQDALAPPTLWRTHQAWPGTAGYPTMHFTSADVKWRQTEAENCAMNTGVNAAKRHKRSLEKPTFGNFKQIKAKFYHHLLDVWSSWLDEQEATRNLQASCSTYITEWDYTFFFFSFFPSFFASKRSSHIWQRAELHFNELCTVAYLRNTTQLKSSACSPLSTLSSELHWATDRQGKAKKNTRQKMQMKRSTLLPFGSATKEAERVEDVSGCQARRGAAQQQDGGRGS